jgi:glycerate kinase
MKIVIAIDSYKGTISSVQAGNAIKEGLNAYFPSINDGVKIFPMADGGEGTLEAVLAFEKNAQLQKTTAKDCLMRDRIIPFIIIKQNKKVSAVVEMASIAGLAQMNKSELDVMKATTYGVGQCIKTALDIGADTIYLGIGGSATNDAGIGMMQALGARFLNADKNNIQPGAAQIGDIEDIDLSGLDGRINTTRFVSVSDVKNPFYGPAGATRVYGPQKGATPAQVELIDKMFEKFSGIVFNKLGIDLQSIKGAGAGGGIGGGAAAFLRSEFKTGADWLIEYSKIEQSIADADLVITGEGRTDEQTFNDKLPLRIGAICRKHGKKAIVISGGRTIGKYDMSSYGIDAVYALTDYFDIDSAMGDTKYCLIEATKKICEELF